jgi:hypothetical protein
MRAGIAGAFSVCSVFLWACAGEPADEGTTGSGQRAASVAIDAVDLSGTWVSHVVTTGRITVPLVNDQPATIDLILRIAIAQDGTDLSNHLEFCQLNTATDGGSLVVNFPDTVLPLLTDDQTIPAPDVDVGDPVPVPDFAIEVGQDADGNPVDDDADGDDGVTIPTVLLGTSIMAFSGLDIGLSFPAVTLTDADTLTGDSAFATAGTVFDTQPLGLSGPISVTPDNPTTPFTAARLAGDVPCSEVLDLFP